MDAEMGPVGTLHHHPGHLTTASTTTAAPLGSNHTQWANYLNVASAAFSLQLGVTIVRCADRLIGEVVQWRRPLLGPSPG